MALKPNRADKTRRPAQQRRRAARQKSRSARDRTQRRRPGRAATNRQSLLRLCQWFLPDDSIFAGLRLHGNTKWLPRCLAWLALCWCLVDARHVVDAFDQALAVCPSLFPATPATYQGFMAALVGSRAGLIPLLRGVLHRRMQQIGSPHWRIDGWVPIAFDGSRSTAPRTKSNEAAFCADNYGKGKTARYKKKKSKGMRRRKNERSKPQPQEPQAWVTLMWHMGLRLAWTWRLGPSNASERGHVMEMAQQEEFPADTLFCGDAGFVGYPLWSCLAGRDYHFLVRVGANVKLLTEENEWRLEASGDGEYSVLCWPKEAIRGKKRPLRLRLLRVEAGNSRVWLLTNVLDQQRLTAQMASRIYRMRWGVELEFRGLKQTLQRARLRCRNDRRLLVELDWSILAMAVVELLALKEQQQQRAEQGQEAADPAKRSLAGALRAIRKCLRHLDDVPEPGQDLQSRLRAAVTDSYTRKTSKKARYRPPNPDKKPLGDPEVRPLDPEERLLLLEYAAAAAS
jgi:hypothetical protein